MLLSTLERENLGESIHFTLHATMHNKTQNVVIPGLRLVHGYCVNII